ncbi:glycogen debranching enzyme GlgX [Desulfomonile tiedjei DSM 6799]|uniref:Glycogen debranching enzyme GlgX n=2 Tax=Desulfomonile tiedjei TaxID=2358 RepID=I4C127_DESTA|nr:glycogen debranching enzyme GlgX [Desulfomonile tiedjei DSM 6799]
MRIFLQNLHNHLMNVSDKENRVYRTKPGSRYPTGATFSIEGTNFSVFSRRAESAELLLYDSPDGSKPFQIIKLDPGTNRTYFFWHVFVEKLPENTYYTWRMDGPSDTAQSGCRFDGSVELVDPWAVAVSDCLWDRRKAKAKDPTARPIRAAVVSNSYDWEDDSPLVKPVEDTIIYEMHVGGFTRHPSSNVKYPGTFLGIIEKIPYLKDLGITHVELMPVMAFDPQDLPDCAFELGLRNFWGYSTHSFFSPHPGYCVSPENGVTEFRDMVKALHKADIGIILDVVLNHTAEGGADGPTINFKGFSNESFYHLDPRDRSVYLDFTGCGNTLNCNHPLVSIFILQCLEYWVRKMHVDGFRFDLASVLTRGVDGTPMEHAPVVWSIEFSEILAEIPIIAEAWDAGGLYQVGAFPGFRWAEWNGKYRDVIRRFIKGDKGIIGDVATRLSGSSDLYAASGRLPINSTNFVTCHDGFTLADLVSYNRKHNIENCEDNRDGTDHNLSWNCGHEGPTDDPQIQLLRLRQVKNFITVLMLSQGIPMLLSGDEVLRSQHGNNNAYCQDNPTSWFDWSLVEKNKDMLRFVTMMIAFRNRHPSLKRVRFLTGTKCASARIPDIVWHGTGLNEPEWGNFDSRALGFTLAGLKDGEEDLHVMLNMSDEPLRMGILPLSGLTWYRAVDTWRRSPEEVAEPNDQHSVKSEYYIVQPHSIVVLESRSTSRNV